MAGKATPQQSPGRDFLGENLRELPYFRAILRAVEARNYPELDLEEPLLDLGCGDGVFIRTAFDHPVTVGVDPWTGPVRLAGKSGGYQLVAQSLGNNLPFAGGYFASVVSNSVLEHIQDVDAVLKDVARVVRPGGRFVFCVPSQNFLGNLSVSSFLYRIGLKPLAESYRRFFNNISRHNHCDNPEIWNSRLVTAGFEIELWWHYFSPEALGVLEWGHYFGLPSLILHWLTRRWIIARADWNLTLTRAIVQRYFDEPREQPRGSYTFYTARRKP